MGFLSDATSFLDDTIFGTEGSTTTIQAKDKIMPADATENALYDDLGTLNQSNLDYATLLQGDQQGLYNQTMQNMYDWQNQFGNMQYDGQLNPMMAQQLEQMLGNQMSNINNYANEGVGGIMNNYANKGVLNSSATGKTMGDLGRNVQNLQNDAQNNYMNQYMQQYGQQYGADMQHMLAQNQAMMQPYNLNQSAYNSAYSDPYNMWDNIRSDRYGLQNDYLQTPSTDGLLQSMGSSLAMIPFL